jgi:sec-independent protein translocase protein TatB
VFGMSFGELCVLVIVAIVVIGPKDLPRYLRKAGQLAGKLRRMATDVRAQSGIDDVLRSEGLGKDIAEIRRLTSGDFIKSTAASPFAPASAAGVASVSGATGAALAGTVGTSEPLQANEIEIVREREYPREGADSYGAIPDTAIVYAHGLPVSALAKDPLYVVGDADAPLPPPPPEPEPEPDAIGDELPPPEKAPDKAPEADAAPVPVTDAEHA